MEKTKVIPVLYCYPKQISLAQQKMKIYPNKQKKVRREILDIFLSAPHH